MVVDDTCPRCGKEVTRGHKAHLMACGGERPPRQPRASDREELSVRGGGVEGALGMAFRRQVAVRASLAKAAAAQGPSVRMYLQAAAPWLHAALSCSHTVPCPPPRAQQQ